MKRSGSPGGQWQPVQEKKRALELRHCTCNTKQVRINTYVHERKPDASEHTCIRWDGSQQNCNNYIHKDNITAVDGPNARTQHTQRTWHCKAGRRNKKIHEILTGQYCSQIYIYTAMYIEASGNEQAPRQGQGTVDDAETVALETLAVADLATLPFELGVAIPRPSIIISPVLVMDDVVVVTVPWSDELPLLCA